MPVFKKGTLSLNLGIVRISGQLDDEDRQCAWELYTELITRTAVIGRIDDNGNDDFSGEVFAESLDSMYAYFTEARGLMRRFPVGAIRTTSESHLGCFIGRSLEVVYRPFLSKWQSTFRNYWSQRPEGADAFMFQRQFPAHDALVADWTRVRQFARASASDLANAYDLVDVRASIPNGFRALEVNETRALFGER